MAVVRTPVLCVLALAVAVRGAWLERSELVWLAYAAMAACTLKLLLEDLRTQRNVYCNVTFLLWRGLGSPAQGYSEEGANARGLIPGSCFSENLNGSGARESRARTPASHG
jgi:hypothetical protein